MKGSEVLGEYGGVIKRIDPEKGFGFIACDALSAQIAGDVYVHQKHVLEFKVGSEVKFEAYLLNGRLQGRDLKDATGLVGPQQGAVPGMGSVKGLGKSGGSSAGTGVSDQDIGVFVGS